MLTLAKRRLSTQTGHFGRVVDPSSSTKSGENTFEIRIRIEKQILEKSIVEDFYDFENTPNNKVCSHDAFMLKIPAKLLVKHC